MSNGGVILVTGATGKQGGAVARMLASQGFAVKGLVRHPDSAAANELRRLKIEIVQGDLNDTPSYEQHLKDVYGVYSVQTFEQGVEKEIRQGTALATMAKKSGVSHFVYASVACADQKTGIPHFESKFRIENHIKSIGLPFTLLRPPSFYENFLLPQVLGRILKGKYVSPLNKTAVQAFIAVEDIGKIGAQIFGNPAKYIGATVTIASEQMDMQEVANVFSKVLRKEVKYAKLPFLITRLALGKDLYLMFKWINDHGFKLDEAIVTTRNQFGDLLNLERWIEKSFRSQV